MGPTNIACYVISFLQVSLFVFCIFISTFHTGITEQEYSRAAKYIRPIIRRHTLLEW